MPRILLVEDDTNIVANLTEYLHSEGFETDSANGQSLAIAKMEENKYDLLLVDISLKKAMALLSVPLQRQRKFLLYFCLHRVMNTV